MNPWTPDAFIAQMRENTLAEAKRGLLSETEREENKRRLSERLQPVPRHRPELAPVLLETNDVGEVIRERVEIGTYEGLRMPVYVLRPKQASGPLPVALALHGHGYGSREIVGLSPEGEEQGEGSGIHKHYAFALARRGCLVVAPELLGFGDRRLKEDAQADPRQSSCPQLASYLLLMGKTLAGVRTYEAMRAIDYALTREDALQGVGCMGLSGGGMIAALTAVLDERIRACVLSGYANTYQDSILSCKHCLDNYVPGLLELGEMADLIGLYAPRALYVESGTQDTVFPLKGSLAAAESLQAVYRELGAEERFVHEVFEGRHEVSGANAYDWLKRQLS